MEHLWQNAHPGVNLWSPIGGSPHHSASSEFIVTPSYDTAQYKQEDTLVNSDLTNNCRSKTEY